MDTNRQPANFLTTVKLSFVIQQRWGNGQDWRDARYVSASSTMERAIEKAASYRAGIARGEYFDGSPEPTVQPQLRIVQRVSEWTPLAVEV